MSNEILTYYNSLAEKYDEDRFANTYGRFIHEQEDKVLAQFFHASNFNRNLDLACGTGRFLSYANFGVDLSPEMVSVAAGRFPKKDIRVAPAEQLPFEKDFFENVFTMHLFMHLDVERVKMILEEVNRVLAKGGYFIFDIPSQKRRKLTRFKAHSWHGANHMDIEALSKICEEKWEIVSSHGIAFFPIHRIPQKIRKYIVRFDNFMCQSMFKGLSSHVIYILRKK